MSILSTNSDDASGQTSCNWHQSLRNAIRSENELRQVLKLPTPGESEPLLERVADDFPVFAPREFVARMRVGDPRDPLLLQVLPTAAEAMEAAGFVADPVGDLEAAQLESTSTDVVMNGVLKKYHGRALLITTGACAVHCRYCFRRHFPYGNAPRGMADWQPALDRIAADATIEEVILSGGDPLTLRDTWLRQLVEKIASIPHVRRLRVHTRLPVMIPSRVNDALLDWLGATRLVPIMVLHANHANELLGDEVKAALMRLVQAKVPLLNQAVLLRGINDTVDALESLSRELVANRVMPYYLHQLDRVAGAAHFEVPVEEGRRLMRSLRDRLPGYMVPRYVIEQAGAASKTVIDY